ncbi:hypothetical protein C8Q74DRAFT_1222753 [Fomes fomentarius]|nr:hypothetical protein C8Q74DRAFT_1222753 [Fomes fomentarius]
MNSTNPPAPCPLASNPAEIHLVTVLEMNICTWKIGQAILAYPGQADDLCNKHFAHGIARELTQWGAISSMGIASSLAQVEDTARGLPTLPGLVAAILKQVMWVGMWIHVNMLDINKSGLLPLIELLSSPPDARLVGEKWWTWHGRNVTGMPTRTSHIDG